MMHSLIFATSLYVLFVTVTTLITSSSSSFFGADAKDVVVPLTPYPGTKIHSLYFAPVKYNHTLLGPYNTYSNTEVGYYYIAQWNNPTPFVDAGTITPPNQGCFFHSSNSNGNNSFPALQSYEPLWSVQNENFRVCALKNFANPSGLLQVQLAQSGSSNLQCGKEFDLFLSPNDLKTYPHHNSVGNQNVNHATLTEIHAIDIAFGLDLVFDQVRRRCSGANGDGCGPSGQLDYGYLTIGFPLSNPIAKQTIFYQILLFDTRENNVNCSQSFSDICTPDPNAEGRWYFSKLPTLGVNFNIGTFLSNSDDCINTRPGRNQVRNVWYNSSNFNMRKFFATITGSVKEAAMKFGADDDLSHWEIGSWYLGSGLQGDVDMTTVVSFEKFEGIA